MKPKVLTASLMICEKILIEKDNVHSLIRMVDLFHIPAKVSADPTVQEFLELTAVSLFKLEADDESTHDVEMWLEGPSGEPRRLGGIQMKGEANPRGAPRGFNGRANVSVEAIEGLHLLSVRVDGEEVAKAYFNIERTQIEAERPEA